MVSDEHYEICLPILGDPTLEDEDKTDRLEEILRDKTNLTGASLDNVVLDALWRYRDGGTNSASPPPIRQTILRRPSPAYPWRTTSGTPLSGSPRLGVSPLAPPGFGRIPTKPSGAGASSPFSSPRPSPRLALAQPIPIPHSPNLNAYEFAMDTTPAAEITAGEHPGENVEWLVGGDDSVSLSSSVGTGSVLNAAAPEFSSSFSSMPAMPAAATAAHAQHQSDMTPYDMLRSILGHSKTDDEIETALALNNYDLSATVAAMMDMPDEDGAPGVPLEDTKTADAKSVPVGKSVHVDTRPSTPISSMQKGIICKFYLSTGQCLRADCRFSHDLSNHLCKYWVMGNCLAGETCIFSHDPAQLVSKLAIEGSSTPPPPARHAGIPIQDYNSFPSLGPSTPEHLGYGPHPTLSLTPPPGFKPLPGSDVVRPWSRPGSRHNLNQQPKEMAPSFDDPEAFPHLGASAKQAKKHHGKRGGHVHGHKDSGGGGGQSLLADIVKMAPSPAGGVVLRPESRRMVRNGSANGTRNGENSAAAQAIPSPKHIPWLEVGENVNKAYLRARHEAIKHCGQRNKFLQSAAQAWNRNDARAAKALSLRGQSENELMRKAHREAARELYEERNKDRTEGETGEIYVDLHGLHADEAVSYLEQVLMGNDLETRPVYAITGTAHYSKNGRDKVGRAVRNFLNEWRYAFREFSVPSDRNNMGGIMGVDAKSWDRSLVRDGSGNENGAPSSSVESIDSMGRNGDALGASDGDVGDAPAEGGGALLNTPAPDAAQDKEAGGVDILSQGVEIGGGKVRLLVKDPPKGPSGKW